MADRTPNVPSFYPPHVLAAAQVLTKQLAREGKLVRGGFVVYKTLRLENATATEQENARFAYMAGAEHVFTSMMNVLDSDAEPTDADMVHMDLIWKEIEAFRVEMMTRIQDDKWPQP